MTTNDLNCKTKPSNITLPTRVDTESKALAGKLRVSRSSLIAALLDFANFGIPTTQDSAYIFRHIEKVIFINQALEKTKGEKNDYVVEKRKTVEIEVKHFREESLEASISLEKAHSAAKLMMDHMQNLTPEGRAHLEEMKAALSKSAGTARKAASIMADPSEIPPGEPAKKAKKKA